MKEITIKEVKFPTSFDLFKQFVEVKIPVDAWLDETPEDIDEWEVEYELIDHSGKVKYRCLTRFYGLKDDFIVIAIIQTQSLT